MLAAKILLFAFLLLAAIILLLLILPFDLSVSFNGKKPSAAVKLFGIKIFDTSAVASENPSLSEKSAVSENEESSSSDFFKRLTAKFGVREALCRLARLCSDIIKELERLFKKIKFKEITLEFSVGSPDAAQTACLYAAACTAVYPVSSALIAATGCKKNSIAISPDFDDERLKLFARISVRSRLIFVLIAALKILRKYKKFKDVCLNE